MLSPIAERAIKRTIESRRSLSITGDKEHYQSVWSPNPGPQADAYNSAAHIIGYGGAAGGGKSDLLLGKAFTQHKRSIIFRNHYTDLGDMVTRGDEILGDTTSFVWGIKRRWNLPGDRQVELGAIEHNKDRRKYRGRPHDFLGVDEAAEFAEETIRFLMAWLRTTDKEQKTQVMLCFNPPMDPEGEWIIKFFAPWLDELYPNPAKPGDLRWFIHANDRDEEVPGPEPITRNGQTYTPQSRTFIPARLEDNPYYAGTEYEVELNNLKEPLRSQLRYGDFSIKQKDDRWQVISTSWILAAQERGRKIPKPDVSLRALGVDVAHGGADNTVIAPIWGNWFGPMTIIPGGETPNGDEVAKAVDDMWDKSAPIGVDAIGYGASACDTMVNWGMKPMPINFGAASSRLDKTHRFQFFNQRAEFYFALADALNPDSGEDLCLPDSRTLRADLAAQRYKIVRGKIQLIEKEKIREKLGRSPDEGDALVLAWRAAQRLGGPIVLEW